MLTCRLCLAQLHLDYSFQSRGDQTNKSMSTNMGLAEGEKRKIFGIKFLENKRVSRQDLTPMARSSAGH